jgi:hypothetical protein
MFYNVCRETTVLEIHNAAKWGKTFFSSVMMITLVKCTHEARRTPGRICDRNIMEYTKDKFCDKRGNSIYHIQFDVIQRLKFCDDCINVSVRHEVQRKCKYTSSVRCTDTSRCKCSNCNCGMKDEGNST